MHSIHCDVHIVTGNRRAVVTLSKRTKLNCEFKKNVGNAPDPLGPHRGPSPFKISTFASVKLIRGFAIMHCIINVPLTSRRLRIHRTS